MRGKIGTIGGTTVGRGSGGKIKMFILTVYKRIFMNFKTEFAKNRDLYRINSFTIVFLQKSAIYIDFEWGPGKQKSILTGGQGSNTKHRAEPIHPDRPCPRMVDPPGSPTVPIYEE